jgi:hypothetical protein
MRGQLAMLLAAALVSLAACAPLTPEQQVEIDRYKFYQRCCGGGGS